MYALNLRRNRSARTAAATAFILLFGALSACGGDNAGLTASATLIPASVTALSGDGQSAIVGSALAQSLVVKVATASGTPIKGATVTFAITSGSASLSATSVQTDSTGAAQTQVTVGAIAGSVVVQATVMGTTLTTSFSITSLATTAGTSCTTPLTMAIGGAVTISGSSVCVSSSSAAEFALVPFNTSTTAATKSTFAVQPTGITTVASDVASIATAGALGTSGVNASVTGRQAFEMRLRARERAELTPRISSARNWMASRGASGGARLNVIPSTVAVGSLVTLNSNADQACTNPDMRAARVMAVGKKAIVVADTLNPSNGYTQAEYASIATTFDDVVDAIDTKAFGQPSDIDGNGHVVLYFTSAVNALTPKNAGYYIGGFFYSRDLFPNTSTATIDACATSNVAEMFYLLVPDPSGAINGNAFSKTFVTSATISTTAHEYQHLINASRRLYVNTAATDFEETWLDEGLAHMAEELLFYGRAGLSPLTNINATLLRSNDTYRTTFNDDAIANFSRLGSFLTNPSANSPYADNDSLATRGATWSFLRYAIDQQSATQESLLYQIVNSNFTGLTNLRTVFGSDLTPLFRDWATSLILDDVSGAASRYQAKSWNLASIMGAINTSGAYGLSTKSLTNSATTSVAISGGSAAYLRFGVAAGGSASLSWTAPAAMQTTLVRLK